VIENKIKTNDNVFFVRYWFFILISFLFIFNVQATSISDVVKNVLPSAVALNTDKKSGSGVIVSEDGFILTNKHVVDDSRFIEVELIDGKKFNAKIIGEDDYNDIAVLKIETKEKLLPAVFTNKKVNLGDDVIVIGNLHNLGISVTKGVISALDRKNSSVRYGRNMQISVVTDYGSSGGAVFNVDGTIVGLVFASHTKHDGVTFSIPSDIVENIVEEIKRFGSVKYGDIGVKAQDIDKNALELLGVRSGVIITEVVKNSPAEKAGILLSDIIVKYGDFKINNVNDLVGLISTTEVDSNVNISVFRNKKLKDISVKVKEKKDDAAMEEYIELFGMYLLPLNKSTAEKLGVSNSISGLYVYFVDTDSVAEISGLKSGDILLYANQKQIADRKTLLDSINISRNNVFIIKREQENRVLLMRNK
jgi:serine protease Do